MVLLLVYYVTVFKHWTQFKAGAPNQTLRP